MRSKARPCLERGCPEITFTGSRCSSHAAAYERARGSRTARGYDNDWLRLRRLAISAQPWCSKCGAVDDLTADHIRPLNKGGLTIGSNLQVLCRSCNSAKRDR